MKPVGVMIVDDSAVVRTVGREILEREPDIRVLGVASDPIVALERMKEAWPDVIVLDIEMPRMDGVTFLRRIMAERPTPTVICSSLAGPGAQLTMDALAAGAVSIITKPKLGLKGFLENAGDDLVAAVRGASRAVVSRLKAPPAPEALAPAAGETGTFQTTDKVVALGTSTGGTQALEFVLRGLSSSCPGIVVVQHMPEKFTALFAERLDSLCAVEVREAAAGDRVIPGRVLIAPGGRHMMMRRSGAQYVVDIMDGPPVNRHRPSVDVLFRSVARAAGANALGVIMTGMGDDGARGLLLMREAGARTVAEDEASCVVFGMPKVAIEIGAAMRVLPLSAIPAEIVAHGR